VKGHESIGTEPDNIERCTREVRDLMNKLKTNLNTKREKNGKKRLPQRSKKGTHWKDKNAGMWKPKKSKHFIT
jgi:hypothetical protein